MTIHLPSFRGDAKHRTRNLEIPRCAIAHLRFASATRPGMTAKGPADVLRSVTRLGIVDVGLPSACTERSALQPFFGRAENIVRKLGIAHGAGKHERPDQRGDGRERLLIALALLDPGTHSVA